ncbi:LacI family transcriptional regulator [Paenibacillus pectinilyticus]|uniref:LacI family transcriptional regulator n=1 Tax=Paenibacillus pectinilyticus TaxID=512399 RepID=A0A1C1A6Y6_9BACL|nr:substrate-binding domain-containing protein [Paenibacillus pectinilyticus]OCT16325.1 LacI family transcriptional regulator [Paenibacillus pectinilyticus]
MRNKSWTLGLLGLFLIICCVMVQFLASTLKIDQLVQQMVQSGVQQKPYKHVVLIAQELDNPFWRTVEKGASEAAARLGMKIDYWGPIRINPAEQTNLLEKSITTKPDALLVQGIKEAQYDLLISKAIDQGIPVITLDADEPASRRLTYVGTDNREAGRRMGELVLEAASEKGRIGVIIGSELAENQQQRLEGFRSALAKAPLFEIIDIRSSNISRIQAAKHTEAMLKQYPAIQTMVGFSSLDAAGIVEGVKAVHREGIAVFGFDDIEATRQGIAQGTIRASVVQQPQEIGAQSVHMLDAYFHQNTLPAQQYTGTYILDMSNLSDQASTPTP